MDRVLSTRTIPAAGNWEKCMGPVFRPFPNSHQYSFYIRLHKMDFFAFSGQNKVTKMYLKYILTRNYKLSSQYQILINRSGEIKQYTKLLSLYRLCEYEYGRHSDCVSNIYGLFGWHMI